MVIEVKKLKKEFVTKVKKNILMSQKVKKVAVDNISFEVEKGDIIGFIGPNGAGKSTTIKIITGVISKTSGDISVLGLDPSKDRKKLMYKIGCMFGQKSQLYMHLTVRDSFILIGSIYDISKNDLNERIEYIAELFEISEYMDKTVRRLSLGQRMICEIAACIIHKPEIIFLDEPTIGLDVVAKLRVREIIKKLNDEGVTVILTSHDVSDVNALCNKIIVINKGVIEENTELDEIKAKYLSKKTIDIIYSTIVDRKKIKGNVKILNDNEIEVEVDTKKESIGDIISYYTSIGDVSDISIMEVSMEEIIKNIYEKRGKNE